MGSKSRIARPISEILNRRIQVSGVDTYIEPFVGGANLIEHINCPMRKGSDLNKYLIALFQHLQSGGELLKAVPRELYSEVRANYKTADYEPWYVANIGFLASYNGRWFDGGYAPSGYEDTPNGERYRDYYREAKDNLLKQMPYIQDVEFSVCDYREITLPDSPCVIYCDPPYQSGKQYANALNFDYTVFWETMREWSRKHYVYISEMNAPEDFETVWEKSTLRSIKSTDKEFKIERLFTYKEGIAND